MFDFADPDNPTIYAKIASIPCTERTLRHQEDNSVSGSAGPSYGKEGDCDRFSPKLLQT